MIFATAGYSVEREAYKLLVGLTEGNLARLQQGQPIPLKGEAVELPEPGLDMVVFYARDREHLIEQIGPFYEKVTGQTDVTIPVVQLANHVTVTLMMRQSSKVLVCFGFFPEALASLRERNVLQARCRPAAGQPGTPVEVQFVWRLTMDMLLEFVHAQGLIRPDTRIRDETK